MSVAMRCPNCDAEIPENGRFCIECGQPVAQTATGPTERLPEPAGGPLCSSCGTRNPPGAQFCVMCGRALNASATVDAPPPAPFPPLPPSQPLAPNPALTPIPPSPPQPMPVGARPWRGSSMGGGITGGLFLIGLAVLALTGWWWPGILVLIGITSLAGSLLSGQLWLGLQGALWMFGIALIVITNFWWPGILLLAGISAIIATLLRPRRGW